MIVEENHTQNEKPYQLIRKTMTREEVYEKYGKVSYAFRKLEDGRIFVLAISTEEPQYLKTDLLVDQYTDFTSVDTFIDIIYYGDVI